MARQRRNGEGSIIWRPSRNNNDGGYTVRFMVKGELVAKWFSVRTLGTREAAYAAAENYRAAVSTELAANKNSSRGPRYALHNAIQTALASLPAATAAAASAAPDDGADDADDGADDDYDPDADSDEGTDDDCFSFTDAEDDRAADVLRELSDSAAAPEEAAEKEEEPKEQEQQEREEAPEPEQEAQEEPQPPAEFEPAAPADEFEAPADGDVIDLAALAKLQEEHDSANDIPTLKESIADAQREITALVHKAELPRIEGLAPIKIAYKFASDPPTGGTLTVKPCRTAQEILAVAAEKFPTRGGHVHLYCDDVKLCNNWPIGVYDVVKDGATLTLCTRADYMRRRAQKLFSYFSSPDNDDMTVRDLKLKWKLLEEVATLRSDEAAMRRLVDSQAKERLADIEKEIAKAVTEAREQMEAYRAHQVVVTNLVRQRARLASQAGLELLDRGDEDGSKRARFDAAEYL